MPANTFNELFHALRGDHLREMPPGAKAFLSAGCAGTWYFEWIAANYPGLERHIGVELYSPRPADLPANVQWIANSVADMRDVPTGSIDLIFSGQNIEHLMQPEIAGFLRESRRVLKDDGVIVVDSPNRAVTESIGWFHPEHVVEFRVDEICEVVALAGFDVTSVQGLWQCYDPVRHVALPLDPGEDDAANRARVLAGRDDPENAFGWWLTARKSSREGDFAAIDQRVSQIAGRAYGGMRSRFRSQIGTVVNAGFTSEAVGEAGVAGFLVFGPYVPLFRGRYHVSFRLRLRQPLRPKLFGAQHLGYIDVSSAYQKRDIARLDFTTRELSQPDADGYCRLGLTFDVPDVLFGTEFRVYTTGDAALAATLPTDFRRIGDL